MTIALLLGRFQPIHNGHLAIIKKILEEHSFVKIALGSAQYSGMKDNPFSALERTQMIRLSLENEGITSFDIFPVPDIHDELAYPEHVLKIVGKVDALYAVDNKNTADIFSGVIPEIIKMKRIDGIKSREIREYMKHGDNYWKKLVPKKVASYLEAIDAVERIKEAD